MTRTSSIPLTLRVPNAPSVFVGRDEALATFVAAAKRGPVAVLCGPPGVGKTALLLHGLHRSFSRRVEAMRYVRVGRAQPAEAALQALTAGDTLRGDDWSGLLADGDAAPAAALDLAEASEAWVVLDADDAAEPQAVDRWVSTVARFARRSRWLVTTRSAPTEDEYLRDQVVPLGGLSEEEMRALAQRLAPGADEEWVAWALRAAGGSPGWLRHTLALERSLPGGPERLREHLHARLLASMEPEDRDALQALAVAEVPLPASATGLTEDGRARLRAAGWLEPRPEGMLAVTPVLRAQMAAVMPAEEWRAACGAAAAALASERAPIWTLEALRLWLAAQRVEAAAAWLETTGESLLASGYAARLWALLEPRGSPELARWRLRAAVEAGASAALRDLSPPADPTPATRLDWARALSLRGDLSAAAEAADQVRAETSDPALARSALALAARCAMNGGRIEEALARLEAVADDDLPLATQRVTCRVVLGRPGALDEARALLERVAAADDGDAVRARLPIAILFYRMGRLRESGEAFDALLRDEAAAPLSLRRPDVSFVHFAVRVNLGQLDEASRTLVRLRPLLHGESLWGLPLALGAAGLRLARGELDGLDAELERLVEVAGRRGRAELASFGRALRDELRRLRGDIEPGPAPPGDVAVPYYALSEALQRARCTARAGHAIEVPSVPEHSDLKIAARLVASDAALVRGEPAWAAAEAEAALAIAREHGLGIREADALEALVDAWLAAGAWSAAAAPAEALAARAAAMGSPRFIGEAEWRRLAGAATPDRAAFERLAGSTTAPMAARRSRALLGDREVPLDAVDRAVLAGVQARPGWAPPDGPATAWRPGWGVDVAGQRVWLADGSWVELQSRPQLWKLLRALVDAGGEADKETLVRLVWDEPGYHPLRHDNRLHATVRNLRVALGDGDPPALVLTTELGYRLADPVRIVPEAPP